MIAQLAAGLDISSALRGEVVEANELLLMLKEARLACVKKIKEGQRTFAICRLNRSFATLIKRDSFS